MLLLWRYCFHRVLTLSQRTITSATTSATTSTTTTNPRGDCYIGLVLSKDYHHLIERFSRHKETIVNIVAAAVAVGSTLRRRLPRYIGRAVVGLWPGPSRANSDTVAQLSGDLRIPEAGSGFGGSLARLRRDKQARAYAA
jgi:hypothetical protein